MGDIPWGSHICQFYQGREDLIDTLVPYFRVGLASGEQCLWVTGPPLGVRDAVALLRAAVPDLDGHLREGRIDVLDCGTWYTQCPLDQLVHAWLARGARALDRGFAGLRVAGDPRIKRKGWERFAHYEAGLDQALRDQRIMILCNHSLKKCVPECMLAVVRSHQFALVRHAGDWELIESASLKIAKEELRKLNGELEERVRARTAELEKALRSRDEFLSVASHELKTPVATFKLYLDGIARALGRGSLDPEETKRRLDKAEEQCERLGELIQNLLDFSRMSSGSLPMRPEEVDLVELARLAVERFEGEARKAGCRLVLTGVRSAAGQWDRVRLEQILTNLVANALKYAPGAPIEIAVRRDGDSTALSVRDHGPGIAPEDQGRVFERFCRVATEAHPAGFGLGLWIVRQIAAAMGGAVHLTSELGEGSIFVVTLPRSGAPRTMEAP